MALLAASVKVLAAGLLHVLQWAKEYGPIYRLWLGLPVYVVSELTPAE
jgi:hypothetical protein